MDYFEELTDADIAAFIEANEWKFAKTMARIPHEYCLKERCTDPEYKARRYGTRLVFAERWYPSSRLCSVCGWKHETLTLGEREWTCPECGTHHDRDYNAALNLQRLATATALPEASPAGNGGAAAERVSAVVGKVTPVRYECGHQDTSGQEGNRAHLRARS